MQNWILWAVIAVVVILVLMYNRLVGLRQTRRSAFSDIDVQLKLRYDLIPNLMETVKGYAAHEKGVFEQVTAARASAMRGGSIADRAQAESALGAAMMNLMAVAENYPALKANENFQQLQMDLSDIENKIAAARRFFNNATAEYNTAIEQFPAVLIARAFNFREEAFFEVTGDEQKAIQSAPKVTFGS